MNIYMVTFRGWKLFENLPWEQQGTFWPADIEDKSIVGKPKHVQETWGGLKMSLIAVPQFSWLKSNKL